MLNSLIRNTTLFFILLFPLFYLPFTSESYDYNKMVLMVVADLLLLILLTLKFAQEKKIYLVKNTFGWPLFLLAGMAAASTLFASPTPLVALTTPLSTTTFISSFILYLMLIYVFAAGLVTPLQIGTVLTFDGILISVYTILSFLGIFPNNSFTPAGNLLATTAFLSVIAIYLLSYLIVITINTSILKTGDAREGSQESLKTPRGWQATNTPRRWPRDSFQVEETEKHFIFYSLALLLITATTIFLIYQLLAGQKPIILPFQYGWAIALEILKDIKTLLLGIGPANFITAFTLAKPLAFNTTPYWNVTFTSSSSFFLNLITETGAISGILYLAIILKSLKLLKSPITNYQLPITLLFSLILQIFLPSSAVLFTLTIIFLAICSQKEQVSLPLLARAALARLFSVIPLIFSLILAGLVLYFGGRLYLAEVYFKQSLDAILNNKPTQTYDLQKKAISLAPLLDRYHLAFSQTNLALAQGIASKKELTEEDKQYLPRLVYQAIDHARTAVTLYRTNILNWDNLARTYTALVNYALGADQWAIVSYRQKIALDPLSPSAHLALGNLYKFLNKFDLAAEEFRRAVRLKNDLANAHYQLALVLKADNKNQQAYDELQTTLALLKAETDEAKTVRKELDDLRKLLPPQPATVSGQPAALPTDQTLEIVPSETVLETLPTSFPTISIEQTPLTP